MSTLKVNTIQNEAGTSSVPVGTVINGSAKAWVNFNGTGTVAIRRAHNVTSITDNGTGSWIVNFSTPMVDSQYAFSVSGPLNSAGDGRVTYGASWQAANGTGKVMTTSALKVMCYLLANDTMNDSETVCVTVFS